MKKQELAFVCLFVILLVSTQLVVCQIINVGRCPAGVKTVQNFIATRYLGLWYEYAKYPFLFEAGAKCITAEYGALGSGKVSVLNTQTSAFNTLQSIEGTAQIVGPGKLSVRFDGFAALAGAADYWVLDTDYEKYAVVYSCTNLVVAHTQVIWVLTRDRKPSADIVNKARNVIVRANLALQPLKLTDQSNCE